MLCHHHLHLHLTINATTHHIMVGSSSQSYQMHAAIRTYIDTTYMGRCHVSTHTYTHIHTVTHPVTLTIGVVAELSAYNCRLCTSPSVVADSPPLAVDAHFHTPLCLSGTSRQPHFTSLTGKTGVHHCMGKIKSSIIILLKFVEILQN